MTTETLKAIEIRQLTTMTRYVEVCVEQAMEEMYNIKHHAIYDRKTNQDAIDQAIVELRVAIKILENKGIDEGEQ